MVLEGLYGSAEDADSVDVPRAVIDHGLMIDSADAYSGGHNEDLVGKAIAWRRAEAYVATKFGIVFDPAESGTELSTGWGFSLNINGTPGYVQRALDASLKRMGTDYVDLYCAHYPDPAVDIEETVGAMARAVEAGKVRQIGLSNVTADEVRRAHAVHPIAAVQW